MPSGSARRGPPRAVWQPAPAKVNLGLVVTGRRADGYHLLLTLYHTLELRDWVLVEAEPFSCDCRSSFPGDASREVPGYGSAGTTIDVSWDVRPGRHGISACQLVGVGHSSGAGTGCPGNERTGMGTGAGTRAELMRLCLGMDLVPTGRDNLACRAVSRFTELTRPRTRAGVPGSPGGSACSSGSSAGMNLAVRALVKTIPAGAGLGGGSADAAAALRGAALLTAARAGGTMESGYETAEDGRLAYRSPAWETVAGAAPVKEAAASLGADVPFAVAGGAALAMGTGERFACLPALDWPVVVVKPSFGLATAEVFRWYDQDRGGENGRVAQREAAEKRDAILSLAQVLATTGEDRRREQLARHITTWGRELPNDLAPVVYARFPELSAWRERLAASSALLYGMTGSGSALFALADGEPGLARLWDELAREHGAPGPALILASRLTPGWPAIGLTALPGGSIVGMNRLGRGNDPRC